MKAKKLLTGLILAFSTLPCAHSVLAAPFCVVLPSGLQCRYYNYEQCMRALGPEGSCAVNSAEVRQSKTVAPFCLVIPYSGAVQCSFYDAKMCSEAATASAGVCLSSRRGATITEQGTTIPEQGSEAAPGNAGAATPGFGTSYVPGQTAPLPNDLKR